MQAPLQITFRGIAPSDALEARIRKKAAKLETFHHHITRCHVAIEENARHQHQGRQFTARIDVRLPQHEIAINRDHDEDVYVALRDAFDAAARRIEDIARVQRGEIKSRRPPAKK